MIVVNHLLPPPTVPFDSRQIYVSADDVGMFWAPDPFLETQRAILTLVINFVKMWIMDGV